MQHIVKSGETLSSIAGDYRVTVSSLIQANAFSNPNLIFPGQLINIPGYPDPTKLPYTIYISLTNRTLSLYRNGALMKVYPVGVGRMLHDTPTGNYIIINKAPNPGGPFGTMWMSISKTTLRHTRYERSFFNWKICIKRVHSHAKSRCGRTC